METRNDIKIRWEQGGRGGPPPAPLTGRDLQAIVTSRARAELVTVGQFVWAAIVYQIILYSFLAHTLVRYWGNVSIVLLCAAGAALYLPLTAALIQKVRRLFRPSGFPVLDVFHRVEAEHTRLADFFRFKKRLDWIGVPVSCAIIVFVTFTLFVDGGLSGNPVGGLVVFTLWVGMSAIAIRAENEKRFMAPLRRLAALLDDLRNPVTTADWSSADIEL